MGSRYLKFAKTCVGCEANTGHTRTQPQLPTEIPNENMQLVSIDFSSRTPNGNYLISANCERSRFQIIKVTRSLTAKEAIQKLKSIFEQYGTPKIVKSDNGPAFRSKEFMNFAKTMGFTHKKITPYWPNSNGLCEGGMRLINKAIRAANAKNEKWPIVLDKLLKRYRAVPHPSTGYSPNEVMGLDDEIGLPNPNKRAVNQSTVNRNDAIAKTKYKKYADKQKHARTSNIKENDYVFFKWERTNKHQPLFDPIRYKITKPNGTMATAERPGHSITRNISFFKRAYIQPTTKIQNVKNTYFILPSFHRSTSFKT